VWKWDLSSPKSYPLNTSYFFATLEEELEGKPEKAGPVRLPPPSPPPKSFADLLDDHVIKAMYEEQNDGSYKDALYRAAKDYKQGTRMWRKLLRAADTAYAITYYSLELAPRPRVHFLHRELLSLAAKYLPDSTLAGLVEFFEDMCPCGKTHTVDAIRKLKKRCAKSVQ